MPIISKEDQNFIAGFGALHDPCLVDLRPGCCEIHGKTVLAYHAITVNALSPIFADGLTVILV